MSTKIYNGYKTRAMSSYELGQFAGKLRSVIRPIGRKLSFEWWAGHLTHAVDYLSSQGQWPFENFAPKDEDPVYWAFSRWVQETIKEQKRKFNDFELDCNFVLLPLRKKTLILIYNQKPEYLKAFEAMPEVSPYWYWDNTDRDEEVSAAAWRRRKQDWDEALVHRGIPSISGLTVECFVDYMDFHMLDKAKNLISNVPDFNTRVSDVAYNAAFRKRSEEIGADSEKMSRHWVDIVKWLKTPEGKKAIKDEAERIAPFLPLINEKVFFGKVGDLRRKEPEA